MKEDVQRWLVDWFSRRDSAGVFTKAEDLDTDYFKAGWIDSFGAVELIDDVERQFRIKFPQAALEDARFSTMRGLAELVSEQTK